MTSSFACISEKKLAEIVAKAAIESRAGNHAIAFDLIRGVARAHLRPELIMSAAKTSAAASASGKTGSIMFFAVIGEVTTTAIAAALQVAACSLGQFARVIEMPFGTLTQQVLDPESKLSLSQPDIILMAPDPTGAANLHADSHADAEKATKDLCQYWINIWDTIMTRFPKVRLIQNLYEEPIEDYAGILENKLAWSPLRLTRAVNDALIAKAPNTVHFVDTDRLAARVGRKSWKDPRLWHHGKVPFTPKHLTDYVIALAAVLQNSLGKDAKALVVDLDNTLWGGELGEDGVGGIRLGPGSPEGEAYHAFCHYIKGLAKRGIILGICSKNDLANVERVFHEHSHMPLRIEDFSAVCCNWEDKAGNLMQIAQQLNMDLSAILFIDDNPAECELVRQKIPTVRILHLDGDPAFFSRKLDSVHLFNSQAMSKEDLCRTKSYQALNNSEALKIQATDLSSYLESLEMTGRFSVAVDNDLIRLTQMEMKTNQFNLTTRRWTSNQISGFMSSKNHDVFCLHLKDRFADHGLVASMVVEYGCKEARILSWLLSCRVFSRTCEEFMMDNLIVRAKKKGVLKISGQYLPTEKNQVIQDLYIKFGFVKLLHQQIFECDITSVTARSSKIKEGIV